MQVIQVSSPTTSLTLSSASLDGTPSSTTTSKGKESVPKEKGKSRVTFVKDINLEDEIVIPDWDLSNLSTDQMDILGELLKKRAKQ